MLKKFLFILCALASFGACKKADVADGTPRCIEKSVKDFEKNASCPDARIDEFTWREATVYVYEPGSCGADMSAPVKDADCNDLGSLGGITGNTTIQGEDFSNAVFVRTVWKK